MAHRTVLVLLAVLGLLSVVAGWRIDASRTSTLSPADAARRVTRATAIPLTRLPEINSPGRANIAATYSGQLGARTALVVVFDSPQATRQLTGARPTAAGSQVASIRSRNTVVIYSGDDAPARRRAIAAALEHP